MGGCCTVESASSESNDNSNSQNMEPVPHQPNNDIDALIKEMLTVIKTIVHNDQEAPYPLVRLHEIADQEGGWLNIIKSMIRTIPMNNPLGQLVTTLVLDDCPLPSMESIVTLSTALGLSSTKAQSPSANIDQERNTCIILGCIAERLPGPNSILLLTKGCLDYLISLLNVENDPNIVLFAIIALEKFSQTRENKATIIRRLQIENNNPFLILEDFVDSEDYNWRQVGFCAQWCLDNLFLEEGRRFTYEDLKHYNINCMLNCNDASQYLKISPSGLEARCDSHSFESVRCTYEANFGVWYYEALIITPGVMQIGWATKNSSFMNHDGFGIGDDPYSLSYDGCRKLLWFNAIPHGQEIANNNIPPWKPGDVLGCVIDIEDKLMMFFLNGVHVISTCLMFTNAKTGFFAAASFMSFQQCRFNFGAETFRCPPEYLEYKTFNDFAHLPEDQKTILPKHIFLNKLNESFDVDGDSCTLCYENKADIVIHPCGHDGFCLKCSTQITECPLCRGKITSIQETTNNKTDSNDSKKENHNKQSVENKENNTNNIEENKEREH